MHLCSPRQPASLLDENIDLSRHGQCYLHGPLLLSPDNTTVENLRAVCLDHAKLGENSLSPSLDSRFFGPSPSQVLYLIEVRPCVLSHCMFSCLFCSGNQFFQPFEFDQPVVQ